MSRPCILAPVDAPSSRAILAAARRFAEVGGGDVRLLDLHGGGKPPLAERLNLGPEALAGLKIETAGAGDPAVEILRAADAANADLIVMPAGEIQTGDALGAATLSVLLHTHRPTVLIHPERFRANWRLRKVLLPHDGDPANSDAVRPGAALAKTAGAELILLRVAVPQDDACAEAGAMAQPRYVDQPQHEWGAWTEEFIARFVNGCRLDGLDVRLLLGHGEVADEILRVARAEAVDLILLAWKGQWEPSRAAIFKTVVRDADCPVMVIRA